MKTDLLTTQWMFFTDTQRRTELLDSPSSFKTYTSNMRTLQKVRKALLLCFLIMASIVETISKQR